MLWYKTGAFLRLRTPSVQKIEEKSDDEERSDTNLKIKEFATAKDFLDWGLGVFPKGATRKVNFDLFANKKAFSVLDYDTWFTSRLLTTLERVVNTV